MWDPHWYGPTKTLDVHVASLRKKLGDPGWIETVRGVGFRLSRAGPRDRPTSRLAVKRRLLVSYLSITAFVLLVLEIPLGVSYANSVERRLTSDLQHDAFSLAIQSQEPLDADAARARAGPQRCRRSPTDYQRRRRRPRRDRRRATAAASPTPTRPSRDRRATSRPGPRSQRALAGAEVSGTRVVAHARRSDLLYVALPGRLGDRHPGRGAHHVPGVDRRRPASATSGCCSRRPAASCSASCSSPACCSPVR